MSAQRGFNIEDDIKSGQISGVLTEFDSEVLSAIKESTFTYWENELEYRLLDISDYEKFKDIKYLKGETYFTSQVPSLNTPPVTIRLSSEFARLSLHNTLGSNSNEFKLMDLSELEIRILNSYCDYLYKSFSNFLISPEALDKVQLKNKNVYNFVIVTKDKDDKNSTIIVTLPQIRLKKKEIKKRDNFSDEDFKNLSALVDIEAGSSKITLNDLKTMSEGDIILLEKSNVNRMKIRAGSKLEDFKVNPDPSLIIELDEDEHDIEREETDTRNMWDDIQIEVNAEFKKVKMTLGELKQISKGLVIDLGSIFNNEISLLVEDKVVATGELVIINDRYAVKVNDVAVSEHTEAAKKPSPTPQKKDAKTAQKPQTAAKPAQKPAPKPAPKANSQDEVEEDFDYSDFEDEK